MLCIESNLTGKGFRYDENQFFEHETELAVTSINNADTLVLGTLLAFITIMKHERLRFHAESKLDKTA